MSLLEVKEVSKWYGRDVRANDTISLEIEAGEVFGLLGPNGAGKSTLVNQIIGLVAPNSGTIVLSGVDIVANPEQARQLCSYQPQTQVPIEGVTPFQAIELVGRLRGGEAGAVRRRANKLIDDLDIRPWSGVSGERLSGGVRRLTAFCMAAVVPGQLIILDEPTNDIDPLRRRMLWREVRRLSDAGSAVLLVTHNVSEAERLVDRLAIINRGKVVAAGTAASLKGYENGALRLELLLEPETEIQELPAMISGAITVGRRLIARVQGDQVRPAVEWAQQMKKSEIVEEYAIGPTTLEDAYVRIISHPEIRETSSQEVDHVITAALAS